MINTNGHKIYLVIEDTDYSDLREWFCRDTRTNTIVPVDRLFPATIAPAIKELHYKAYFVKKAYESLVTDINDLMPKLKERIEPPKSDFIVALRDRPDILKAAELSFETRSTWFYSEIYFFELKSFLDFVASISFKFLGIKTAAHTFGKKKDKRTGKIEPGLEFIEVLRNNAPAKMTQQRDYLIDLFLRHKKIWIDTAIRLRDTTTHYRTIKTDFSIKADKLEAPLDNITLFGMVDNEPYNTLLKRIDNGFRQLLPEYLSLLRIAS